MFKSQKNWVLFGSSLPWSQGEVNLHIPKKKTIIANWYKDKPSATIGFHKTQLGFGRNCHSPYNIICKCCQGLYQSGTNFWGY